MGRRPVAWVVKETWLDNCVNNQGTHMLRAVVATDSG